MKSTLLTLSLLALAGILLAGCAHHRRGGQAGHSCCSDPSKQEPKAKAPSQHHH